MPPATYSCLHDYSYFVGCVRKYIGQGYSLRDGVALATEECIDKGILADILIKHRAEVLDMFLTTFDKKMYEEAIRDEGWEAGRNEGWEAGRNEGWKGFPLQKRRISCLILTWRSLRRFMKRIKNGYL